MWRDCFYKPCDTQKDPQTVLSVLYFLCWKKDDFIHLRHAIIKFLPRDLSIGGKNVEPSPSTGRAVTKSTVYPETYNNDHDGEIGIVLHI